MKANEAPEKLYYAPYGDIREDNPITDNDIEYVRKDAFVEKACEYFRGGLEDTKVIDDYRKILVRGIQASYTSVEEFIGDFKRYMEGE